MSYEFSIAADGDYSLGRVQYAICKHCGVGLLKKISFSPEWHCCGFGTLALREPETRHPGDQHPCPHF
ncbi:hypothetical protein [Nonomuraea rhodomycinica]|uniref:Uncharacterized protein n=1 Tax=Nonomuraea rhodomycinica TaxID=1712872 RepID=A0A7Y6IJT7_9ACTN|nr:hypothetical protein [Nonomuraea rhodomycinica]NUW39584.1 hypothetical protein [Nonomuraea rhodomycinica]